MANPFSAKRTEFLWLAKAGYSEQNREVIVEFANREEKIVKRFPFYPKAIFCLRERQKPLQETLARLDSRNIAVSVKGNCLKVSASNFSELKRVCALLEIALHSKPLLLSPERQFLAENNWSYFDSFRACIGGELEKGNFCLPNLKTGIDLESLPKTIQGLLEKNRKLAERLSEKIVLSSLLCLPLEKVPESKAVALEHFLDVSRFRHGIPLPSNPVLPIESPVPDFTGNQLPDSTEIDFSQVWPLLLTFPFYNLGNETMNCDCCRPERVDSENVLPSSLALVEFSSNGIYLESGNPKFALEYHSLNPNVLERRRFQSEWAMSFPPLGPFFSGQKAEIPAGDGLRLQAEGKCKVLGFGSEPQWFCTKSESFLSKTITGLSQKISFTERALVSKERRAVASRGIGAGALLESDLHYSFFRANLSVLNGIMAAIPVQLRLQFSRHYDPKLAGAVSAIQSGVLFSFRQFARQKGSRTVISGSSALLESGSCLATARDFSSRHMLPAPQILRRN